MEFFKTHKHLVTAVCAVASLAIAAIAGKDFYDFMFKELFVYNREGKVELIDDSDYKRLEGYRKQYEEKANEIEKEIEYE